MSFLNAIRINMMQQQSRRYPNSPIKAVAAAFATPAYMACRAFGTEPDPRYYGVLGLLSWHELNSKMSSVDTAVLVAEVREHKDPPFLAKTFDFIDGSDVLTSDNDLSNLFAGFLFDGIMKVLLDTIGNGAGLRKNQARLDLFSAICPVTDKMAPLCDLIYAECGILIPLCPPERGVIEKHEKIELEKQNPPGDPPVYRPLPPYSNN